MIRFRHDPTTGALYFRLREGEIAETLELPTPGAYVDIDEDGNIMGLEFLNLQEFLYSIDSAHGELGLPDRIEPGASLAPSDHAAE